MLDLTYEDVRKIVEKNDAFKMKHQKFGEVEVAQATYFLASAGDFFDAHKDGSGVRATELRGISFIKEPGKDWKRYLFIDKFFNVNQTNGNDITWMDLTINGIKEKVDINKLFSDGTKIHRAQDLKSGMRVGVFDKKEEKIVGEMFEIETLEKNILPVENRENSWMYEDLKDKKIIEIADKEDGSAIRFLKINGKLVAKTKYSFESEQTDIAMNVVDNNPNLKKFIEETLDRDFAAIFEIVSPLNKIVLAYNETSLRLLQIRDEKTGEYLDVYDNHLVRKYNIVCAKKEPLCSLETLLENAKTVENKEGWVVTFEDGKMAKVKTKWYLELHGILTGGLKEHILVEKALNEEIDDLLAEIPPENVEERSFINDLTDVVDEHANRLATETIKLVEDNFDFETFDKKSFAKQFNKHKLFHYAMRYINNSQTYEEVLKNISNDVKFKTRRLEMAKEYLRQIGFERELNIPDED